MQNIIHISRRICGVALLTGAISGCVMTQSQGNMPTTETWPAMQRFENSPPPGPTRSNRALAEDFLNLSFQLENGETLPVMTRLEGPITLRTAGPVSAVTRSDLSALLHRIRAEAGVSITEVTPPQPANITVEFVPASAVQRIVPSAVCVVVPGVSGWQEYQRQNRADRGAWTRLQKRETLSVFVPQNLAPQDIRDCLHEELAQALGPVNDMWHLQDSVFNDDNFHVVLTRFDMLMLRITYDRALRSGLTRAQVAARLPAILERINPEGSYSAGRGQPGQAPARWRDAIETALYSTAPARKRLAAAQDAIAAAQTQEPQLLAFAHYVQGRLLAGRDGQASLNALLNAGKIYDQTPGAQLQAAHVAHRLAFEALKAGNTQDAIRLIDGARPIIEKAQNAIVLSSLLMLKAQAFEYEGRLAEAQTQRQAAIGWALYGIGDPATINRRLRDIASLPPARPANGEI
ncbi:MAG: DUF2927 domain-containing protein [Halocynthiibacter sp.]